MLVVMVVIPFLQVIEGGKGRSGNNHPEALSQTGKDRENLFSPGSHFETSGYLNCSW